MAEAAHATGAPLWGVSAEFDSEDALLAALHSLRDRGFGRIDAFSPMPISGLADTLGLHRSSMYGVAAAGAVVGTVAMVAMCTYATVWDYVFLIGGRPRFSWPSFVVPSVASGMLVGALAVFFVTMVFCRLPRLNHPAFNIPDFTRASEDRFFVAVEGRSDDFDPDRVEAVLATLRDRPLRVSRVPR